MKIENSSQPITGVSVNEGQKNAEKPLALGLVPAQNKVCT